MLFNRRKESNINSLLTVEINKIYCGDCLNLLDQVEDGSPNLIILSPPDIAGTNFTGIKEYKEFLVGVCQKSVSKLNNNGVLVSITTDRRIDRTVYTKHIDIINSLDGLATLFNYKIWSKSNGINFFIPNFAHILCFRKSNKITNNNIKDFWPDVFRIDRDNIKGYNNKDSFPSKLIEIIILNYTTENNLVLDPFIGSGKTAVQCIKNNRNYIGFDINPNYVRVAEANINKELLYA